VIAVPDDVRPLVERVYAGDEPDADAVRAVGLGPEILAEARRDFTVRQEKLKGEAKQRLLGEPTSQGDFAANPTLTFDEDTADLGGWFAGQTRYEDEPTVRAILVDRADSLADRLIAAARSPVVPVSPGLLRVALEHSVPLANRALVRHVRDAVGPDGSDGRLFRLDRVRALAGHALITLVGNRYQWRHDGKTHDLELDAELGVVFDRHHPRTEG
jgi:hypothetical protein